MADEAAPADKAKAAEVAKGENLASLLKMDELTLEIGFQLIPLVDEKQGGQMLNRVRALRRHLATELGFIVPAGAYYGQSATEAAGVCGEPARRGDRTLADGAELSAGGECRSEGAGAAGNRDQGAGVWRAWRGGFSRDWRSRRLLPGIRLWTRLR